MLGIVCLLLWLSSAVAADGSSRSEPGYSPPVTLQTAGSEATQAEIRELKKGQVIERELAVGEAHTYRIALASGEYAKAVIEQKNIKVVVRLFGTDGRKIADIDSDPIVGIEPISLLAETSVEYRLEVRPQDKEAATGHYEIRVEEWRQATSQDRDRVAAQGAFWEADQLRAQGSAESLRKAIEKYRQALPLWRTVTDRRKEALTLNEIGFVYSSLGETQQALQFYNQALPLFRAVRDVRQESITLNNIGAVYSKMGDLQKALDYLFQTLPLKQAMGDRRSESNTLHNIAFTYSQLGEFQKALEYYDKALPLRRMTGDRLGESITRNSIGSVYFKMGEWQKALEYHSQGLALVRVVGDRRNEAVTLHNVGMVYSQLGELQKALEYYDQALPLRRAVGDRYGEAYTLDSIATTYFVLFESQKALDYHNQALLLRRAVGDKYGEAYTLSNIGAVYGRLGKLQEAMDYFNQALTMRQAVGDRRGEALSLRNIGAAYRELKEPQKALEYYTRALALGRAIGDRNSEAVILSDLARVERDQQHLSEARAQIEASLALVESARSSVSSQELRASYMTTKRSFYEFYIDLLMQLHREQPSAGHDAVALKASESARARSLLDLLTEARADIRQGVDPALLERESSLQQQLSAKAERLTRLLSSKHTEEQATAARKEVEILEESYQEVEAQIRAKNPRYAALTQPQSLGVREIQHQVVDKDTLLLEYALGEQRSYLWAVSAAEVKSYELPARAELENRARRVYDLLTARNRIVKFEAPDERQARIAKAEAEYYQAAGSLSEMLLGPVAAMLPGKRLLIVADGALQYLPFVALPAPAMNQAKKKVQRPGNSYRPLIIDHEVISLPSATVLGVLRRELAGREPAPKVAAVLADPVFDKNDERVTSANSVVKSVSGKAKSDEARLEALESEVVRSIREVGITNGWELARLPFTRQEAEALVSLTAEAERLKALDFDANRAAATNPELGQYRIVHFATHGLLNSTHPGLSGLILSLVDREGHEQNGFLPAFEIFNLKLPAELVVLSGCQTGLGREVKGEGLLSLTRGFMYAGAARVVVSLWEVNDQSTAELMKSLYRGILGAERMSPAAALRAAQISVWKTQRWHSPYYWAAFTLQGEPR